METRGAPAPGRRPAPGRCPGAGARRGATSVRMTAVSHCPRPRWWARRRHPDQVRHRAGPWSTCWLHGPPRMGFKLGPADGIRRPTRECPCPDRLRRGRLNPEHPDRPRRGPGLLAVVLQRGCWQPPLRRWQLPSSIAAGSGASDAGSCGGLAATRPGRESSALARAGATASSGWPQLWMRRLGCPSGLSPWCGRILRSSGGVPSGQPGGLVSLAAWGWAGCMDEGADWACQARL